MGYRDDEEKKKKPDDFMQLASTYNEAPDNVSNDDNPVDYSSFQNLGIDPKVLQYLQKLQDEKRRGSDADYQKALMRTASTTPSLLQQFGAGFNKSMAQMGTVGGKVADTSAPQDFANEITRQQDNRAQTMLKQNQLDNQNMQQDIGNAQGMIKTQAASTEKQKDRDSAESRAETMALGMANKTDKIEEKQTRKELLHRDEATSKLGAQMVPETAKASSVFGRNAMVQNSALKLQILEDKMKAGEPITDSDMREAATAFAKMIQGGSALAVSQIEHIDNPSLRRDVGKLTQYIAGQPVSAGQQEFLKNFLRMARGEAWATGEDNKRIKADMIHAAGSTVNQDELYNKHFTAAELKEIKAHPQGKYTPKPFDYGGKKKGEIKEGRRYSPSMGKPQPGDYSLKDGHIYDFNAQTNTWLLREDRSE